MTSSINITGLGLLTPLARDADANFDAMLAGKYLRNHSRVSLDRNEHRLDQLSLAVSREALAQANWSDSDIADSQTALILGTSKGPIEDWISRDANIARADFGLASCAAQLAKNLRWGGGIRATYSAACASGLHALIRATMLLQSGQAKRALVVAVESSVHPLFIGSFNRLGVLSREGDGCKPLDKNRAGFFISEAAAAVCLEVGETSRSIARIDRFALAGDSHHITSADPAGRPLRHVLARAIDNRPVDLIHAHATGTQANDAIELAAIDDCVVGDSPIIFSHKAAIGHSLGASGLISIVLNCIAHQKNIVPGNVRTDSPLAALRCVISKNPIEEKINRSVAIAAGFGGALAAVSLTR